MIRLKGYQERTLDRLRTYLEAARVIGPKDAFDGLMKDAGGVLSYQRYKPITGLEDAPYVCLRLPTGGGKTILASYSVEVAARHYLEQDYPVVLWLVPTNTIRQQTLEALKKPGHPYREAIDNAFEGRVSVFDVSEIEHIRPQDLTDRVCLIVGTLATLRVNDTDGRKIYSHNENFEPHFARVSPSAPGLECIEEGPDKGKLKFSFANLLHLHNPLVIMDEAHNARTALTFEVLQRIRPACLIEFTATPDTDKKSGSNVLYSATASELKAEEMIKLPIMLTEHKIWQDAIRDAVITLNKLKETAKTDRDYIRPIALIQAESKDKDVTVQVITNHLIENEKIERSKIAIATGSQRELDNVDLFDPACKIEYIITIQALKEGWDCSFAYVFCSLANIKSNKDVEQLLGRVLRMPYATKRKNDELNRAYAHVSSPSFAYAASQLKDRLIDMGFEEEEVDIYLKPQQIEFDPESHPLFAAQQKPAWKHVTSEAPDLSSLTIEEKANVSITELEPGKVEVTVKGAITEDLASKLAESFPKQERAKVKKGIQEHRHFYYKSLSPAERGEAFKVPRLCVYIQGELELAEKELFLDVNGWNLLDFEPALTPGEFSITETANTFEVDG